MRRREFITLLGGAAGWPIAARAQQPALPVIGFMVSSSLGSLRQQVTAFREGLKELAYVEGQNVAIEYRYAEGQPDRFPALAADLVRRQVAVFAVGGAGGARVAKQATTTIPIVFSVGEDPVTAGLVDSLNQPAGNMTGVYQFTAGLEAKRLGLLHEMVPKATTIAVLINSNYSGAEGQLRDVQEAAPRLGVQLLIVRANAESEFNTAFSTLVQQGGRGAPGLRLAILQQPAATACGAGSTPFSAGDLRMARFRGGRRPDELWNEPCRRLSPGRYLCRPNSQRRQARRPAGRAGHQVRVRDQPEHG